MQSCPSQTLLSHPHQQIPATPYGGDNIWYASIAPDFIVKLSNTAESLKVLYGGQTFQLSSSELNNTAKESSFGAAQVGMLKIPQ